MMCSPSTWVTDETGERCHVSAPRGSAKGIQGLGASNPEHHAALSGLYDADTPPAKRRLRRQDGGEAD